MPNPSDDMNNLFRLIAFAALKEMDLSEMKGIELRCQISHRDFVATLRHPLRLRRAVQIKKQEHHRVNSWCSCFFICGERGIRTPGTVARTSV